MIDSIIDACARAQASENLYSNARDDHIAVFERAGNLYSNARDDPPFTLDIRHSFQRHCEQGKTVSPIMLSLRSRS